MKLLLICIFTVSTLYSQVNIETVRASVKKDGIANKLGINWNISDGNTNYSLLNLNYRVDSISDKNHTFAILSLSQGYSDGESIKDKGFMHLRHAYKLSTSNFLEVYAQQEYNKFLDLNSRKLAGVGVRIPHHNTNRWSIVTGHSLMIETEQYDNDRTTNLLRLSEYIAYKFKSSLSTISTIIYFQPALSDFQDFRILSDLKWLIPISDHVSLKSSATIRYDNQPEESVSDFDIDTATGLEITF